MRFRFFAAFFVVVLILASHPLLGQETLSRRDLNTLTRTAHTEEQFGRLETFYKDQAKQFLELERSEKGQMDRAAKMSVYSKYPSEYERTRNLWMYYSSRREQAESQAKLYGEKKKAAQHGADASLGAHS